MTSGRLLAAGALGSALLALGGTGVGALPSSGWGLLRGETGPALALCVLGGLLLGAAWWSSRERDLAHQRRACLLWAAPLLLAPPLFSRDLYAYAGQAALVAAGRDPYADGPGDLPGPLSADVDEVWLDAPAPYGPVWLVLAGTVVRVTGDALVPALVGVRLLAVFGIALTAWALLRLSPDPARALWLGVANPLVLLHLLAGGHNDALMIGLLVTGLAVAATAHGRWALALAAVLVASAALVKVPALAGLAFLPLLHVRAWPERVRAGAVVLATAAATAVAVAAVSGLGWGWLGTLDTGRARLSLFSLTTGVGTAAGALDAVLAGGLVAAAVAGAVLLLRADRLGPLRSLGLTLLAVSVLLPVLQPWYLLWGVVVLAAAAGPRAGPSPVTGAVPPHAVAALGALSLALCLTIAPSGRNVIRPPLYGLPTVLAAAVGLLVLRRELRLDRPPPLADPDPARAQRS